MAATPPVVLTIAGFDPSSGAGVTADIKTLAALNCYGISCITALTVQSTQGVAGVQGVPASIVRQTLDTLVGDFSPAAVRIGMLACAEVATAVADFLAHAGLRNVVLDPILRSSSGAALLDDAGLVVLRDRLLPLATVITPNLAEAAALTGLAVSSPEEVLSAAEALHRLGARSVVVTGGHLEPSIDLLSTAGKHYEFRGERIASHATHGTGCAFATAVAANLAHAVELPDAVRRAGEYVRQAIRHAYPMGKGTGPLNHLWTVK